MIKKIFHKKKMFALIVKKGYRKKKGISFFTDNNANQQIGYMKHGKNYIIKPHSHKKRISKIFITSEVIILLKGILRVDFYDNKQKYLFSIKLYPNEIIYLVHGAHGFKIIKEVEMIEIKQGPYVSNKDKVKFNEINEKKIKIKKI